MKKRVLVCLALVLVFATFSVPAFAESSSSSVSSALTTSFSSIASDAMSMIAAILPVALPIMGAVVLISVGIRIFRKVTGR